MNQFQDTVRVVYWLPEGGTINKTIEPNQDGSPNTRLVTTQYTPHLTMGCFCIFSLGWRDERFFFVMRAPSTPSPRRTGACLMQKSPFNENKSNSNNYSHIIIIPTDNHILYFLIGQLYHHHQHHHILELD